MNQKSFLLTLLLFALLLVGCADDELHIDAPTISGVEQAYSILENETVKLSPTIEGDNYVTYSWLIDDEEVATTLEYTFEGKEAGDYILTFKATNSGGTTESKIKITVYASSDLPIISGIEESYTIIENSFIKLLPVLVGEQDVSYSWLLNGAEVATTLEYTFEGKEVGDYILTFKATNSAGTTEIMINITVYSASNTMNIDAYTIAEIKLPAFVGENDDVKIEVIEAESDIYRLTKNETGTPLFVAAESGSYIVKISSNDMSVD